METKTKEQKQEKGSEKMDKKEQPFILTNDKESANILISCGFQLIDQKYGNYIFINCKNFSFADTKLDLGKITYTKMLCFNPSN